MVALPFYGVVSAKRGRLASQMHFRPNRHPAAGIRQFLRPVKDFLRLRILGCRGCPVFVVVPKLTRLGDQWLSGLGNSPGKCVSISQTNQGLQSIVFY